MDIWELRNAGVNQTAALVYASTDDLDAGMFDLDGRALHWAHAPVVEVFAKPRRKKPKPRADISALQPGAIVLNAKARDALGEFLSAFGQMLPLDCAGSTEYFYNVTTVIDCIDPEHSRVRSSGAIVEEAFIPGALPDKPVFKDPRTARFRIYANGAARAILQGLLDRYSLTGLEFVPPGTP